MTTETIMFTIGIIFFSFMTLYNLKIAIKERKDYAPTIISFLFTATVILIFFEQMFYGLMLFAIIAVVSLVWLIKTILKPSESLHGWDKKISKELEKNSCKESIKFKDFLGLKGFVKIAVKYGAKKAAFFLALFTVTGIFLVLLFIHMIFPEIIQISLGEWVPQVIIGFIFLYYVSNKKFENALKNRDK